MDRARRLIYIFPILSLRKTTQIQCKQPRMKESKGKECKANTCQPHLPRFFDPPTKAFPSLFLAAWMALCFFRLIIPAWWKIECSVRGGKEAEEEEEEEEETAVCKQTSEKELGRHLLLRGEWGTHARRGRAGRQRMCTNHQSVKLAHILHTTCLDVS